MPPSPAPSRRRWLILAIIAVAQLMVVLDATIVNIALPSAQDALGFSDANRQWVVTAYALSFGSLLLLGGRLGDLFGRKTTFLGGMAGFAVASAIGGAAQSFEMLVFARALQGVFGAALAPAGLALLSTTFTDPGERGKAFGIYGAIAGAGGAVGLLLGGVLTEYLSWRWSMYVNLALAVPAAAAALTLLPRSTVAARPRIDLPGTLAISAGLFALVFGFTKAETDGWGAPVTLAFLAAGLALAAIFVAIERRVEHPLLPLRVVVDRNRGGAYLAVGMAGIGMFGVFLFLTFFLQQNLGFTPVQTGLAFLPMVGTLMVTAAVTSTRLYPAFGPKPLIAAGMAFAAAGLVILAQLDLGSSYVTGVLPGIMVMGLGMGFAMASAMQTATLGVAGSDAGVASAMVNVGQQVGGSIGTALLSTLAASAASGFVADAGAAPTRAILAQASVHGYTTGFWWAAAIFAAGAVVCGALLRPGAPSLSAEPATGEFTPALAH